MAKPTRPGRVRVGIGGWSYAPWRATFYPRGLKPSQELEYASRRVTSIEINSTFYRLQRPSVFAKWHAATPPAFVFAVKAPRFVVQRRNLAEAGAAVSRFIESGVTELQGKLGPILWQLAATKRFDPREIEAFLGLLPARAGKLRLRHALEVRHPSFMNAEFVGIAREHRVAVVIEDDAEHPMCADLTSSFVYARLRRCAPKIDTGYSRVALQRWARRATAWSQGREPADLPRIGPASRSGGRAREVFVYFINGAKERAPAAAESLISILGRSA